MTKAIFLICIIFFIIFYIRYRFKKNSSFLITIFIAALVIRMICATGMYLFSQHGGYEGFFSGDESVYYKRAVNIAVAESIYSKNLFSNTPELNDSNYAINPFSILESILIFALGQSLLLIKYFNSIIGALLPIGIFLLSKEIFNDIKLAKIASLLTAFLPSLIVWSSIGIKEPSIILILVGILYFYVKNQESFKFLYFAEIIVLTTILFYLQANLAVIFILLYSTQLIFINLSKLIRKEVLLLIFILLGSYMFLTNQKTIRVNLYRIAEHQSMQCMAGDYNTVRYQLYPYIMRGPHIFGFYNHLIVPADIFYNINIEEGPINVINNIIKIEWVSFFISSCKGLTYALFAPFLWGINSFAQLVVYPQVVFWWGIMPCVFYGIIWSIRFKKKETALMISLIAATYLLLSLTEGNIGSVFRHRDWVTPLCLMFGAVGFSKFLTTINSRALK